MLHSYSSECTSLSLTQELHQRVFDSIHNACSASLQAHLEDCHFGIAPDCNGINTFFIIAPDQTVAQTLLQNSDALLETIADRAIGITQTAICFLPVTKYDPKLLSNGLLRDSNMSKFLVGKVFRHES